jgi:modification methylase
VLPYLPEASVDLVFADPPYNLQLRQNLWRPNMTRVNGVDEAWDQFAGFPEYDAFCREWLLACRRVLKDSGSLWVIGTYHNIYRLGALLQDLGFWILNDIVWVKSNPMPNFRGVRFTNAHETLLWAATGKGARYTFHHHAVKALNDGLQMRSDWYLPLTAAKERVRDQGRKAHPTQKPEALLYRVVLASSNPGDVVLDPFFGTGTTGVVAARLGRHWIGVERQGDYIEIARRRLEAEAGRQAAPASLEVDEGRRRQPRLPFGRLLEEGILRPGQVLYFRARRAHRGTVQADGRLRADGFTGSIHAAGRHLSRGAPCNGWEHWYYETADGTLQPIDRLRRELLEREVQTGGKIGR